MALSVAAFSNEKKILAFSGSTREHSLNKYLVQEAAAIAKEMGAQVTLIDLRDYPMPFYDADLERMQGMPIHAKRLRDLMLQSDAILIASPEYNASMTAILKNVIDWTTRDEEGKSSHEAYLRKKFAIMSASPGKRGGMRSLAHLRQVLEDAKGTVLAKQVTIPRAYTVINVQGILESDAIKNELREEIGELLK